MKKQYLTKACHFLDICSEKIIFYLVLFGISLPKVLKLRNKKIRDSMILSREFVFKMELT